MLTSYVTSWPPLLFGLLTLLAAAFGHGGKYLMKDLGDMSKMPLSHYFSAHLSVLYATILPFCMAVREGGEASDRRLLLLLLLLSLLLLLLLSLLLSSLLL